MLAAKKRPHPRLGHSRAQDIDRYVGARVRERRILMGLTQQQMAEQTGVSYQQTYKYEKGTNRISAGRLFSMAEALSVDVSYFFDGMDSDLSFKSTPQQRMLVELARNFISMPSRKHQEAICTLARTLANLKAEPAGDAIDATT
jgi:transcriptional regulator with XRE-family HTH domain